MTETLRKMTSNERQAFRKLVQWDGRNKDLFWHANQIMVPDGYFTVEQAFIYLNWHRKGCHRTITSLRRYLHIWAEEGMMLERTWYHEGVLHTVYAWKD